MSINELLKSALDHAHLVNSLKQLKRAFKKAQNNWQPTDELLKKIALTEAAIKDHAGRK